MSFRSRRAQQCCQLIAIVTKVSEQHLLEASINLAATNSMFVTPLHDRLGETQCIDALTGEHKVTSLWLRNEGGHNRARGT